MAKSKKAAKGRRDRSGRTQPFIRKLQTVRKRLEKLQVAQGELDDALRDLEDAVLGSAGPGDPRLLSVVPSDLLRRN
jgi:hypothetical protein